MRKKDWGVRFAVISFLAVVFVLLIPLTSAFTDIFQTDNFKFYYYECPLIGESACVPEDEVVAALLLFEMGLDNYNSFGFREPQPIADGGRLEVQQDECDNGCARSSWDIINGFEYWIELPRNVIDRSGTGFNGSIGPNHHIIVHELFHHVQNNYPGGFEPFEGQEYSKWVIEGQARMMQDKTLLAGDFLDGTEIASYYGQVRSYLRNPGKSLGDLSYSAALFWTYFTEQYGTDANEPQRGIDALKEFYDQSSDEYGGVRTVEKALDILSPGTTFEELWQDFTVANIARLLGNVSSKYLYFDEAEVLGPGSFRSVNLSLFQTLNATTSPIKGTGSQGDWAAQYYKVVLGPQINFVDIEFRQDDTNADLLYSMLLVNNNLLSAEFRSFGETKNFIRTLKNNNYDDIVVIVTSIGENPRYNYTFTIAANPTIRIVEPTFENPAIAGNPESPRKISVKLEILNAAGNLTIMPGLDPVNDFQILIGNRSANITSGVNAVNQYWLTVLPPIQDAFGLYDLQVTIPTSSGAINATQIESVLYTNMTAFDNMLVMDTSDSMDNHAKIDAEKIAARGYVDLWQLGDKIGAVSFASSSTIKMNLTDYTDASRNQTIGIINNLTTSGSTSIGSGLRNAGLQLRGLGNNSHAWFIVLLTDGLQNTEPDPYDSSVYPIIVNNSAKKIIIHSIALGQDADTTILENLSVTTGGVFHHLREPESGDLPNTLADVYRSISEETKGEQKFFRKFGNYNDSLPIAIVPIPVEQGAQEATFLLNFKRDPTTLSTPVIRLKDPDDNVIIPRFIDTSLPPSFDESGGHYLYRVQLPEAGVWQAEIDCSGIEFCIGTYVVEAAVTSITTMNVFLDILVSQRITGNYVPIIATLSDVKPIVNASVNVTVITPPLETALAIFPERVIQLQLFDDGRHNDRFPNDGIYGNLFKITDRKGAYEIKVEANSNTPFSGNFVRLKDMAFKLIADSNSDNDKLPDNWEVRFGLSPNNAFGNDGPLGDPDLDGLETLDELEQGTNPIDSDTDNGGENDNSEFLLGRNPNEKHDDAIIGIDDFDVIPTEERPYVNLSNIIYYSSDPEYVDITIWRSQGNDSNFQFLSLDVTVDGEYIDENVANDVKYFYKIAACGVPPLCSAVTETQSATPKADVTPPEGSLVINGDNPVTTNLSVQLTLAADNNTVEMMISNDPSFSDAAFEPFQTSKNWSLAGTDLQFVYAQFKDSYENIGTDVFDGIKVVDFCVVPANDMIIQPNVELCPGVYNISDSDQEGVLIISGNNVILNCNFATLIGNNSGVGIINSGFENVTIKNCNIQDYETAILLSSTVRSFISNNQVSNSINGISVNNAEQTMLLENNAENNDNGLLINGSTVTGIAGNTAQSNTYGILLRDSSFNVIRENILNSNEFGFSLSNSNFAHVENNIIHDNKKNGIELISSNSTLKRNSVCYNQVLDFNLTNPGLFITGVNNTCDNPDGFNDEGLEEGCAFACHRPFIELNPTTVNIIDKDTLIFPGEYYIPDNGPGAIRFNANDVILDCNGAKIIGTGGIGIYNPGFNNTVINSCNVINYDIAMNVKSSTGGVILHSNLTGNEVGIKLFDSHNHYIFSNIFDNVINAIDNGFNYWNITKTPATNIVGGPFLGGNFWHDYDGVDNNGDGIGDTNLPYSSGGNIIYGGDFLPLVILSDFDGDSIKDDVDNCPLIPGCFAYDGCSQGISWAPPLSLEGFSLETRSTLPINFNITDCNNNFVEDKTVKVNVNNETFGVNINYTYGNGSEYVRINTAEQSYIVNFHTDKYPEGVYGIEVTTTQENKISSIESIDVEIIKSSSETKGKAISKTFI